MKIAVFHELHHGGARKALNEFSKRLKKQHIVDIYTTVTDTSEEEKNNFHTTNIFPFTAVRWNGKNWRKKLYKDSIELLRLYHLHRKIAKNIDSKLYDFVFIHPSQYTQAPFILGTLETKKIYYAQETLRMIYEPQFDDIKNLSFGKSLYERSTRLARKLVDKKNIDCADIVLTNSKFTQNNIKEAYGIDSTVSYLGVDHNFFTPSKKIKEIDIFFIGSKSNIDGHALLQKVLQNCKKKLRVLTHIQGENFMNSEKDMLDLYQRSKLVICFSKNEPFGLIPLEAMSCGIPVIALNEGGYKETIINNKTGFLVESDEQKIAEKITYLLNSQELLKRMGIQARRNIVENWTWEKSVQNLVSYF